MFLWCVSQSLSSSLPTLSLSKSPNEPSFLKKLREKHGLKSREEQKEEEVNAKFRKRERVEESDDRDPTEEEQPV